MEIKRIVVGILQANCYLLAAGGDLAVIDPGDEAEKIIDEIDHIGATPKLIINTHAHFDHIGANSRLKEKYGVPVMAGANEKWGTGFSPDAKLFDGQIILVGGQPLRVVDTPGHTPGGICLLGPDFIFSGDTLFDGNIGRTDLDGGSNKDMAESLKKLDRMIAAGMTAYPGHGAPFAYEKGMALKLIDYLI